MRPNALQNSSRPNALQNSAIAYRLDPHVRQVLSRLPGEVVEKLSEEELLALYNSIAGGPRSHSVDLRLSLPLVPKRLYFVTLVGFERRAIATRDSEKSPWNAASVCLAMGMSLIAGLAIGGAGFYVMNKGAKAATASETVPLVREEIAIANEAKLHPIALPWIGDASSCTGTTRQWKEGFCYELKMEEPQF